MFNAEEYRLLKKCRIIESDRVKNSISWLASVLCGGEG